MKHTIIYKCLVCGKVWTEDTLPPYVNGKQIGDDTLVKCVCDDCRVRQVKLSEFDKDSS